MYKARSNPYASRSENPSQRRKTSDVVEEESYIVASNIVNVKDSTPSKAIDLVPMTILTAKAVQGKPIIRPLLCLFDPGATTSWIAERAIPAGTIREKIDRIIGQTVAGTFESSERYTFEQVTLPEFYRTRTLDRLSARLLSASCRYDIILGRDVLSLLGIQLDFKAHVMTWDESTVSMKPFEQHPRAYYSHYDALRYDRR